MEERRITHKRDTGYRKWGFRLTETEVAEWRLGVRNPQELVYPIPRRNPFERSVTKADNGTAGVLAHERCSTNASLQGAEQHPEDIEKGREDGISLSRIFEYIYFSTP